MREGLRKIYRFHLLELFAALSWASQVKLFPALHLTSELSLAKVTYPGAPLEKQGAPESHVCEGHNTRDGRGGVGLHSKTHQQWNFFCFWALGSGCPQEHTATSFFSVILEAIEALPLANTPEVFGLHSNAEIGYYTKAARDMWHHLLELQPQTGRAAAGAHELGCRGRGLLVGSGSFFKNKEACRVHLPCSQPPSPLKCLSSRGIQHWHQPRRLHWPGGQGH